MTNKFVSVDENFEMPPVVQAKQNTYIDARIAQWVRVGNTVIQISAYSTVNRPSAVAAGLGAMIFDTTLVRPVWSDGLRWIEAATTTGGSGNGLATTIGDGVHSTFTVTHALGKDVLVECINLETGQTCWPVVQRSSMTTVYLDFGDTIPAAQSRRVLITKVG